MNSVLACGGSYREAPRLDSLKNNNNNSNNNKKTNQICSQLSESKAVAMGLFSAKASVWPANSHLPVGHQCKPHTSFSSAHQKFRRTHAKLTGWRSLTLRILSLTIVGGVKAPISEYGGMAYLSDHKWQWMILSIAFFLRLWHARDGEICKHISGSHCQI